MGEASRFSDWLRQRRTDLGVPRDELADQVGFSRAMLRKLESGERRPSGQIASLLADYFRVPNDEREAFVTFARVGVSTPIGGRVAARAPWRTAQVLQTNLPTMLTPLIGREEEVQAAIGQLLHARTRLFSMTGPPGVGKTRLALQVASNLVDEFEDGVFFIDLAPVVDPDRVLPMIAANLGLKESGELPIESLLLNHLRDRRILLLLDNFEQVLDAAAGIVKLLEASPWLKVLLTSREALHVRGERRFSVRPLGLPSLKRLPPVNALTDYPSVALFVERAAAVDTRFELMEENARDVAEVCVGLEGLPLAIELAATRARHLTPYQMRLALASRLKLSEDGGRDLPVRQRTLKSAIEWSYSLLSQAEQALFRNLSVFVGGFTIASAKAVSKAMDEHVASRQTSTLQALLSLVDKNLVKQESPGMASSPRSRVDFPEAPEETRYGMLEAIREYAWQELHEPGQQEEAAAVEMRHALYFMNLVEEAEPVLAGKTAEGDWLVRLDAEHNNLLAAIRWAASYKGSLSAPNGEMLTSGSSSQIAAEIGLRIACILWRFWYVRGYIREWQEYLSTALALCPPLDALQPYRAKALTGAGTLAIWRGDYASARRLFEESLAIRRELGDKKSVASALNNLGVIASMQGDYASSRVLYEESLTIRRELKDGVDKTSTANMLHNMAELAGLEGDYASSRALYEESLALRREIGSKEGIAHTLRELGMVIHRQGNPTSARALLEESITIQRELGDKMGMTGALSYLGSIACDQDDYASARSLYRESLSIRREIGAKVLIAGSLADLGHLAAKVGDAYRGATLLAAAAALWEAMNRVPSTYARKIYEQGLTYARDQLTETAFAEAWAEGRALSALNAVALALDEELE